MLAIGTAGHPRRREQHQRRGPVSGAGRETTRRCRPRAARRLVGTTAVHLCFGYAAIIHERPSGYSFLPELADCSCDQISIETGQSNLDTSVLRQLDGKTIILGVIDLSDPAVESVETVVGRVRRALPHVAADKLVIATDCGMKYLPRESALGKMAAMAGAARVLRDE